MWFLTLFTYLAILVQVVFITVAIGKYYSTLVVATVKWYIKFAAAGLYYLAELVEEYTVLTKKCIWWLNTVSTFNITKYGKPLTFALQAILGFYVCLWLFESFPNVMIFCGIGAQMLHYVILKNFPYVYFLSPAFLLGVGFIIINHYIAFQYFAAHYYMFSEVNRQINKIYFKSEVICCRY